MGTATDAARIVVGVDGSRGSRAALSWAVREAELRTTPLDLVHAWSPMRGVTGDSETDLALVARTHGNSMLASAAGQVRVSAPAVDVATHLVQGRPGPVLLDAAVGAYLLVVGSRGLGGFRGMQLGSVGLHAIAHAPCSVAIVRAPARARRPVVVGIDGSPASSCVLKVAFEEAELRGSQLLIVSVLYVPPAIGNAPDREHTFGALRATVYDMLQVLMKGMAQQHPKVDVRTSLPKGYPTEVLANASATAQLLVIGAHGTGAFSGMRLGSTSHALAQEAHCPLIVVRGFNEDA